MPNPKPTSKRCAIYTRKSSEEGLQQAFNSLDAQREACEAYILSQRHEGWSLISTQYDDGGFSGGNTDRPALTSLLQAIKEKQIDVIVVYKVDRLSRSLADFVKLVDLFDRYSVSFVSITQQFNTSTSMGRLTLNVLLSFAQFEREVTSERIRDKIAASKQKGMWMGGVIPIGYDVNDKKLIINPSEAKTVTHIYQRYLALGCVRKLKLELDKQHIVSKPRFLRGKQAGLKPFSRGNLYGTLKNPLYNGKVHHKGQCYEGQHAAIIDDTLWDAVQTRMSKNRNDNDRRTAAKDPSLLAGLLFDDKGNYMSPSHSRKHNRRYRYYVSQASLQFKEEQKGSVIRIAARVIESLVIKCLHKLLNSAQQLLELVQIESHSASDMSQLIKRAAHLCASWDQHANSEQLALLRMMVYSITVSKEQVTIILSRSGMRAAIESGSDEDGFEKPDTPDDRVEIVKSVFLKRCGIESKLVIADDDSSQAHPDTVRAIQNALSKALKWNEALMTGQVASISALAVEEEVVPQFIRRRINLAYLAPDIIQSIIEGQIPDSLSLKKLENSNALDWDEQRRLCS